MINVLLEGLIENDIDHCIAVLMVIAVDLRPQLSTIFPLDLHYLKR